jgi:hypothetical protein
VNGKFLSQDPVFWEDPKDQILENPQSLNSYSYANDNPIRIADPSGRDGASDLLSSGGNLLPPQYLELFSVFLFAYSIASNPATIRSAAINVVNVFKSTPAIATAIGVSLGVGFSSAQIIGPSSGTAASTSALARGIQIPGTALETAAPFDNVILSGKSTIIEKPAGDFDQAKRDFYAKNPQNVQVRPNGTITGELPNGDKINVRPNSTDGRPTLETQGKNGDTTKVRYGPKQ